jgi:hypothetical protein
MSNKTNSFFKQGLFGLCLLALLSAGVGCKGKSGEKKEDVIVKPELNTKGETTNYVRYNESSKEGQANLAALNKAMNIMKNTPCDSTFSWYYQSGIHWVPGSFPGVNNLCASYQGGKASLKTAWDNCTHGPDNNSIHFLVWHRLYIWYLEKIVRKLSGKADFALPYWKYVDPSFRVMPVTFRTTTEALYEKDRESTLNQGQPIEKSFADQYLVAAMQDNNEDKDYETFNSGIESAPHNQMHGYIGGNPGSNRVYQANIGTGLMGAAGSAAFDPIFWVHHANIDYLWEKWYTGTNGKPPLLSDLEANPWPYQFFDENGKFVKYTIKEALEKALNLDYTYDDVPTLESVKISVPQNKEEIFSSDLDQPVTKVQQLINVKIQATVNESVLIKDLTRKSSILLVTVSFKTPPKSSYTVYVDTDNPNPEKQAGHMTFFGLHDMSESMHGMNMDNTKTFLFDISDEHDIKTLKDNLKLLIVNSSGKAATDIKVTKVKLETRDF